MVKMAEVPRINLTSDVKIPVLGLGTWQRTRVFPADTVASAVAQAVDIGYRYFDTAQSYLTEKSLGKGIKAVIDAGKIKREDVFITTKVSPNHHNRADVVRVLRQSLDDLQINQVDLYLIHWPFALKSIETHQTPRDVNGKVLYENDIDFLDTWKGMEDALDFGLTKTIGVCNFNKRQLERLLSNCRIKPVNLQIEANLFFQNTKLIEFSRLKGISVTAYSSLYRLMETEDKNCPDIDVVKEIAKRHGKTIQQVALRFQLQRGLTVIPKSNNKTRLRQNFEVFDFQLSDVEMDELKKLDTNRRSIDLFMEAREYPFSDPY